MKRPIQILLLLVFVSGTTWVYPEDKAPSTEPPYATPSANKPYLHPGGFTSADVLRPKEKLFSPLGWMAYGLTDKTTLVVDWLITLVAVPGVGFRHQFTDRAAKFSQSLDFYSVTFYAHGTVETIKVDKFKVYQSGFQGWLHYATTWRLSQAWRWHNYAGFTYDTYQQYDPRNDATFQTKYYDHYFIPDFGTALEYSPRINLRLNLNYLYGNNFYVFDQNPQHWLVQWSILWQPFYRWKSKFWNSMNIEFFGFYVDFYDLNYRRGFPPLYPVIFWQW